MADWERQSDTRDPLEVLIQREAKTCKGCRFLVSDVCFTIKVEACRLGRKKLRKCSMYAERG